MRQQRSRCPTEPLLGQARGTRATSLAPHSTYPRTSAPAAPPSLPPSRWFSWAGVSIRPLVLLEVEDLTGGPGVEEREPI